MSGTYPITLGDDVTVEHGAVLHGCSVSGRCLVAMGVILINGTDIGTGSIITAGALVIDGMTVPARSLVMGSLARVRRGLTNDEVSSIQPYVDHYVQCKNEHLSP